MHNYRRRLVSAGLLEILEGHTAPVLCFVAAGPLLYSGDDDGHLRVWDLGNCNLLNAVPIHSKGLTALVKSRQNVWCAAKDGRLLVVNIQHFPMQVSAHRLASARCESVRPVEAPCRCHVQSPRWILGPMPRTILQPPSID